jgi:hypothetical protein
MLTASPKTLGDYLPGDLFVKQIFLAAQLSVVALAF